MALEWIMTSDGAIDHGTGAVITGGVFAITSTPSSNVKISGGGVYSDDLVFTFSGGTVDPDPSGLYAPNSAQILIASPGTISPTAVNTKVDGSPVIREGDNNPAVVFTVGLTAGGTTTLPSAVKVSDAGQDKVKAD
jgi:hypothetical protein